MSTLSAFSVILSLYKKLSFISELGGDAQLVRISHSLACQINKCLLSSLEAEMVLVK